MVLKHFVKHIGKLIIFKLRTHINPSYTVYVIVYPIHSYINDLDEIKKIKLIEQNLRKFRITSKTNHKLSLN